MTTPYMVLIDTYNHERYIEQAIVSVQERDFPADEMEIVMVDGPTDESRSILRKYASDPRRHWRDLRSIVAAEKYADR
jgi:glycosyltransferase involved in cell wall biosynthesis